ncbi:Tetratricopeptide repeat protein [Nesidiocoris tenuis]|uniref:Cell division cycle protein 27 homolog n=1 Tax=Nesidiocoris tenuis TaxID=355587 RepID=A0ABN7AIJ8_9HEMI|nr:Tetratricopeptide repeat protein [Nesidiocoris tenuis]
MAEDSQRTSDDKELSKENETVVQRILELNLSEPTELPPAIKTLKLELDSFFEARDVAKTQIESFEEYNDVMEIKVKKAASVFEELENAALEQNKELYWQLRGKLFAGCDCKKFTEEGIRSLAIAVKLNPSSVWSWNLLGQCYYTLNNIEMAIKCFTNALQVAPDLKSLINLSIAIRRQPNRTPQNIQDSLTYAQEAIRLNSHSHTAWMVLGTAHLTSFFGPQRSNVVTLKKALKAYELANHLAPGDFEVCCNLSVTLRYIGKYEEALKTLKSCTTTVLIDQAKILEEYNKLKDWLLNLSRLVVKRGKLRTSKLANFAKIAGESSKKLEPQTADSSDGNVKQFNHGVVIFSVPSTGPFPLAVGLLGADSLIQVVTIFNVVIGKAFKVGTVLSYPQESTVNPLQMEIDDQPVDFNNIPIFNPSDLLLNGKKISPTSLSYSCVHLV